MWITILKFVGLILLGVALAFGFRLFRLGQQSVEVPPNLGLTNGQLQVCGPKPNCVSSEAEPGTGHYIDPLPFEGSRLEAKNHITEFVTTHLGGRLIIDQPDYMHFEMTSKLFGFVDDLEFYLGEVRPDRIEVRSASRVGHSDLGANRRRVEKVRKMLVEKVQGE